jgi:hypothetical protein
VRIVKKLGTVIPLILWIALHVLPHLVNERGRHVFGFDAEIIRDTLGE